MQLNYDQKLKLVALTQQANHGTFSEDLENLPALGALDVIGKDRRSAWASLGDISKDESMKGFIDGVAESMPHLQPHIEAIKKERESIKKQELEAQEKAAEETKIAQEVDEERQSTSSSHVSTNPEFSIYDFFCERKNCLFEKKMTVILTFYNLF